MALDVLCIDAPGGRRLATRLRALGLATATLPLPPLARALAARRPRAAVLDAGLPDALLERALAALEPAVDAGLTLFAAGAPPPEARRARLREAGAVLALFEPLDDATLRHQVNRAFLAARRGGRARRELRAPLATSALVCDAASGQRIPATLYSLSEGGAFAQARRVLAPGARVELRAALGAPGLCRRARVVHVHAPGEAGRAPAGMGLRFAPGAADAAALAARVRARCAELAL